MLADFDQNHVPFAALDSLLRDMETGKEASKILTPHDYRKSMVSLADQSLVPNPVNARKPLEPQTAETWNDQSDSNIFDRNAPQPASLPSPAERSLSPQHHYRASHVSAYSASIYSEDSSATTDGGTRNRASYSGSETQTKSPDARKTPKDGLTENHSNPVGPHESGASTELLTPHPLEWSQPISVVSLTRNSPTHQTATFFLDKSLSESEHSSPSSASRDSGCKGDANENESDTGSAFVSSGSSESIADAKKVRSCVFFRHPIVDNSTCRSLPTL